MKNSIIRAIIAPVNIGYLSFEGLRSDLEEFGIAVPQVAALDLVPPNRSFKQLESLLGIVFQSHQKWKTPLNPKAVNVLTLVDFERLLRKLDKAGNPVAESICDNLIGLSLHQLFSDAFKVKFEEEERQEFLKWRQITRLDFHPVLTDSIQRNVNPKPSEWGKYIKQFQDSQGVESGTRDKLPPEKLARLAMAQNTAAVLLDAGLPWGEVLDRIAA